MARSPHLQLSKHFHSHHPHQRLIRIVAKFSSLFYMSRWHDDTWWIARWSQTDLSPEFGLNIIYGSSFGGRIYFFFRDHTVHVQWMICTGCHCTITPFPTIRVCTRVFHFFLFANIFQVAYQAQCGWRRESLTSTVPNKNEQIDPYHTSLFRLQEQQQHLFRMA